MSAAHRLAQITPKVERAKKHVRDLEAILRPFFESNPYAVGCHRDPKSRKPIYYVASVREVPSDVPLIAGDAIQNLMSALDHLAYQLVCSDTNDEPPNPKWIYFPIRDSFDEYEARKRGKMKGAHDDTFAALDALKPYKGGNDLLWQLFALNNIEKHRLLLTAGSQAAGISVGPLISQLHKGSFGKGLPADKAEMFTSALKNIGVFMMPSDKGFPLKAGFKLYIGGVDEEPNPDLKFRFTVALNEPEIAEGQPIVETLHQQTALVEGIVTALTPRLR